MFIGLDKKPILYKSFFIGSPLDCWPSWILFIKPERQTIKISYTYGQMAYIVTYSQMKDIKKNDAYIPAGYIRMNFNETMITPQQEHFFAQYPDDEPIFYFEPTSVSVNEKVLNTSNISQMVGFIVSQLESPSSGDLLNSDPAETQAFRSNVDGDLSQSYIYPAETWRVEDKAFFLNTGLSSVETQGQNDTEPPKSITENKD